MDRRAFVTGLGAVLGAALSAEAQQTSKVARIGYLAPLGTLGLHQLTEAFRQGLGDLGYVEGRNVVIEYRSAEGQPDRLTAFAAELVALKVDVLVAAGGTRAALTAKQATSIVPVVFIAAGDPVSSGLVRSLARPGGNVTGLSLLFPDLVGKCLEQLKQAVRDVSRVAVLWEPGEVSQGAERVILKEADTAAHALGIRLHVISVRSPADIDGAFSEMSRAHVGALTVLSTPIFVRERSRLVALAAQQRLPTVFSFREYVDAGGLMSYGPDLADLYRRAAVFVDKILKGAKPADLPVEQPTKFDLVINLKAAKALGLTIPPSLLLRADQVIE